MNAVMNILVNFQVWWRLLISFGYHFRNVKKDQSIGSGLRFLMQTQTRFPGGKSDDQRVPAAGRQKRGATRKPRTLGLWSTMPEPQEWLQEHKIGEVWVSIFAKKKATGLHTWREGGGEEEPELTGGFQTLGLAGWVGGWHTDQDEVKESLSVEFLVLFLSSLLPFFFLPNFYLSSS